MKILVTGGCGFIGSNFIRYMLGKYQECRVLNLDALTYAGNPDNLRGIDRERYHFIHGRIEDPEIIPRILDGVDVVVNFAAESHVDRSILDAQPFLTTNVIGLQVLVDAARRAGVRRFVHLSTDEVYGSLETDEGRFTEQTPLAPNSPYAASKAAGDLLIRSYVITYGFPAVIVRPSNNYGPYQYPEKLIPLMITNLIDDRAVPLYGRGLNIRDWLYVEDTCAAIDAIMQRGRPGEVYNVGGGNERRNTEVARKVLSLMGMGEEYVRFVADRPGHDYRYALDCSKIRRDLGWAPKVDLDTGLRKTVHWYRENEWWWRPLKARLGHESQGFWEARR